MSGYDGGIRWAVRWNEVGFPARITRFDSEEEARAFHRLLVARYRELGRTEKPELLTARITWQVAE